MSDKGISLQQSELFPAKSVSAPSGFHYQDEFLAIDEEKALVRWIETLPLKPFEFRGYLGSRRVMYFGFRYDYNRQAVDTASAISAELAPLVARGARWSGREPRDIRQAMSPNTRRARPSAGTATGRNSAMSSEYRCSLLPHSGCAVP